MGANCLLCNEKIKMLGLGATKFEDGKICYGCAHKIKPILELYGKKISQYSLNQLMIISKQHLEKGTAYREALEKLFSKHYALETSIKEHDKSTRLAVEDVKTQIREFLKNYDGKKERLVNICERGDSGSLTIEMWDQKKADLECVNGLEELLSFLEERQTQWEKSKEILELIEGIETYYFREKVLPTEKELFGFEGIGEEKQVDSSKEQAVLKDMLIYMSIVSEKEAMQKNDGDAEKNIILEQYSEYYDGLSDLYVKKALQHDKVLHAEGLKRNAQIMYGLWTRHDFEYAKTNEQTAKQISDSKKRIADYQRNLDRVQKEYEEIESQFLEALNIVVSEEE